MMIPPSINKLARNGNSKYAVVVAVAKRARQLSEEHKNDENWRLSAMVSRALEEVAEGEVKIKGNEEHEQEAGGGDK
ncbi:MAG: DNA-directed RNA polymerase subunit omega [Syntrophothermaceae bacterium]